MYRRAYVRMYAVFIVLTYVVSNTKKIKAEFNIIRHLDHPNICKAYTLTRGLLLVV